LGSTGSGRTIHGRKLRQVDSATSAACAVSATTIIIAKGDRYDAKCVTAL
jgi:hypothetical protein